MAEIKLELVPFPVPSYVSIQWPPGRREDGIQQDRKIPLHELSAETLHEMVNEFKKAVFTKAEKLDLM